MTTLLFGVRYLASLSEVFHFLMYLTQYNDEFFRLFLSLSDNDPKGCKRLQFTMNFLDLFDYGTVLCVIPYFIETERTQ